jgi:hypothetical protein
VTVSWKKPKNPNGIIKRYEIYINKKFRSNCVDANASTSFFEIDNLTSFTQYHIEIVACTVDCSAKSEILNVTTDVSAPGQPQQQISTQKDNKVTLTWKEPQHIGGCLDHYILKVIVDSKNIENGTEKMYQIYGSTCEMTSLICQNHEENYQYSVRAVNSAKKPKSECNVFSRKYLKCESHFFVKDSVDYLYGEWIDFKSFYCPPKGLAWYLIVVIIISGTVFIASFSLSIYLVVNYCTRAKRLKVVLPKQMEDVFKNEQFKSVLLDK